MAYLKNDPEKETQLSAAPMAGGVGPGSAPMTGGASAKPAGPVGSGFVNLQTVLGLNAGQGQKMADAITQPIASAGQQVQQGMQQYGTDAYNARAQDLQSFNPDRYNTLQRQGTDVSARARALGSFGGQQALLADRYGPGSNGGYSGGQQTMDAFLAGAEGGKGMAAASNAYGSLDHALGLAAQNFTPKGQTSAGIDNSLNNHLGGGGVQSGGGAFQAPFSTVPAGEKLPRDRERLSNRYSLGGY